MSAPAPAAAPAPEATPGAGSTRPRPAERGRRPGWLVAAVVLVLVATTVTIMARGAYRDGPLEPGAPTPQGSKALVQVLARDGVETETLRHAADAAAELRAGRPVLLDASAGLSPAQLDLLAEAHREGGGRLVLLRPDLAALRALAPGIIPTGSLEEASDVTAAGACGAVDTRAGTLRVQGEEGALGDSSLYQITADAPADAATCFEAGEGSLLAAAGDVTVLGSPDVLSNEGVAGADNAALALGLLGEEGTLGWYLPSPGDPLASGTPTLIDHLPRWAGPLALWLLAVAALGLWVASRRLGPVVVEPLPVAVRPEELVRGRARLLQSAHAREAAATSLRTAAARRLAGRLGLRGEHTLDALVAALGPHTDRSPAQLRSLLGPAPVPTDQQLVRLARDLDHLEKEIDR